MNWNAITLMQSIKLEVYRDIETLNTEMGASRALHVVKPIKAASAKIRNVGVYIYT